MHGKYLSENKSTLFVRASTWTWPIVRVPLSKAIEAETLERKRDSSLKMTPLPQPPAVSHTVRHESFSGDFSFSPCVVVASSNSHF